MASVRKRVWTHKGVERTAWVVDYTDQSGKRRMLTEKSKKDADRARIRIEADIEAGVHTHKSESVTVAKAVEEFLGNCERRRKVGDRMTGQTLASYRYVLENHVVASIGALRLCNLEAHHVQAVIDEKIGDFSQTTVRKIHDVLHLLLAYAVKKKWAKRNILRDDPVSLPRGGKRRVYVPSKAELKTLISAALDLENEQALTWVNRLVFVCLGAFGGLRKGEIAGLQWSDVDFDKEVIHIRHSQSYHDGLKEPKTQAGVRDVPMSAPIRFALLEVIRYWQTQNAERWNRDYHDITLRKAKLRSFLRKDEEPDLENLPSGHVLVTKIGKPITVNQNKMFWTPLMKKAGLMVGDRPLFSPHALRHAAASLFIENGLPAINLKTVMGHSSVTITYDVYGHLFPEDDRLRQASAAIAADLGAAMTRQTTLLN
ncbi:site-specific integrase [Shinella curvata]|uniref:Site-specific integrase n=1 Tax=Shinella curvata TaxID=1817964 RepID=A0ABT8XHM4_9HYPH|nr:site-specific integrase [Shinella curvata]MCJ8053904.1 site-specific integrase [Shinella curvata]MDO6123236.1 site-specific integrase [Shinella curvata]